MASSDSGRGLQVRWMSFANPAIRRLDRTVLPSGLGGGRRSSAGPRRWPGSAASPTDVTLGSTGSQLACEPTSLLNTWWRVQLKNQLLRRPAQHCRLPAERNCPCSELPGHFLITVPRHWPSAPICLAVLSPLPEASTPQVQSPCNIHLTYRGGLAISGPSVDIPEWSDNGHNNLWLREK